MPIPLNIMRHQVIKRINKSGDRVQRLLKDHYISSNANFAADNNKDNKTSFDNIPMKYVVPSHMLWTVTE